jgi:GT2 family glycosyltransferase
VSVSGVCAGVELSLIIVNWKVRELLRACLASVLERGGLAAHQVQIVVVDNASDDGSVEMVRAEFPGVTLLANSDNVGFGKANNQALPLCVGRYLVLLNPDTIVLDGALAKLVAHMDAFPDVAVIGCRLLNVDGTLQRWTGGAYPRLANLVSHYWFLDRLLPRSLRLPPLYLDHDVPTDVDVDWVSGACMILRPTMLEGRLFDPLFFMYGEDMELCHRMKLAGHRVLYSPVASIIHVQGASMKQQQGDVLLSALKGPREFYRRIRGDRAMGLYDFVTLSGFALRWFLYGLGARLRRSTALDRKAASSRDLMVRAWRMGRAS